MRRMAALADKLDRIAARLRDTAMPVAAKVLHDRAERIRRDMTRLALQQEQRRNPA